MEPATDALFQACVGNTNFMNLVPSFLARHGLTPLTSQVGFGGVVDGVAPKPWCPLDILSSPTYAELGLKLHFDTSACVWISPLCFLFPLIVTHAAVASASPNQSICKSPLRGSHPDQGHAEEPWLPLGEVSDVLVSQGIACRRPRCKSGSASDGCCLYTNTCLDLGLTRTPRSSRESTVSLFGGTRQATGHPILPAQTSQLMAWLWWLHGLRLCGQGTSRFSGHGCAGGARSTWSNSCGVTGSDHLRRCPSAPEIPQSFPQGAASQDHRFAGLGLAGTNMRLGFQRALLLVAAW